MRFKFQAEVALGNDIDEVEVVFNAPTWPAAEQWVERFLGQIGHAYSHLMPGYSITLAPRVGPDYREQGTSNHDRY